MLEVGRLAVRGVDADCFWNTWGPISRSPACHEEKNGCVGWQGGQSIAEVVMWLCVVWCVVCWCFVCPCVLSVCCFLFACGCVCVGGGGVEWRTK